MFLNPSMNHLDQTQIIGSLTCTSSRLAPCPAIIAILWPDGVTRKELKRHHRVAGDTNFMMVIVYEPHLANRGLI